MTAQELSAAFIDYIERPCDEHAEFWALVGDAGPVDLIERRLEELSHEETNDEDEEAGDEPRRA